MATDDEYQQYLNSVGSDDEYAKYLSSLDQPAPSEPPESRLLNAVSGGLNFIPSVGSAIDLAHKYLSPTGILEDRLLTEAGAPPEQRPGLENYSRKAIDYLTGTPGSTKIGQGTPEYSLGTNLATAPLNPFRAVFATGAGLLGKLFGEKIDTQYGGPIGETAGTILGFGLPSVKVPVNGRPPSVFTPTSVAPSAESIVAEGSKLSEAQAGGLSKNIYPKVPKTIKDASALITHAPEEVESLVKGFKIPSGERAEAAPVLLRMKEKGYIPDPGLIEAPDYYASIKKKLITDSKVNRSEISDLLKETDGLTVNDLTPKLSDFDKRPQRAEVYDARSKYVKKEADNIKGLALQEIIPAETPQQALAEYNKIKAAAATEEADFRALRERLAKDPKAEKAYVEKYGQLPTFVPENQNKLLALDTFLDHYRFDGDKVWQLRISYDDVPNFVKDEPLKGDIYRTFRDKQQAKIIEIGGGPDSPLAKSYENLADKIKFDKYVERMKEAEIAGETRQPPLGQRALNMVKTPIKSALGLDIKENPITNIRESYGTTLPQKLFQGGPKAPTKAGISGEKGSASLGAVGLGAAGGTGMAVFSNKSKNTMDKPAEDENLKPLVDAVISQESGGKASATSNKGAQGLMQLMPSTGKELFNKYNIKGEYDPYNPEQNREIGTLYLKELLKKYKGDSELALTAYHSGPGRVDQLLKKTGGSTLADIIDELGPVGRRYAKEVLNRLNLKEA